MSYSRLEKFIYAICSMDVSDLPVPLSRIEKLWNCLITGETPDFEPLSRNEKYLMAMLDRYDISNLPAPMSRGEKLLYKIAVGETDLSDVPGYLSRYEELLKYLIENGGIGGGDFEYVLHTINQSLYTLYTTAEKPVKRAVIHGDTLVNTLQESSSLAVTPMGEAIDAQQASVTGTANGAIQKATLKGDSEVIIGKNKCDMNKTTLGWLDGSSGNISSLNEGVHIPVEVSGTITISNYIHNNIRYIYQYNADGRYLGRTEVTTDTVTITLTEFTTLIKIGFYKGVLDTIKSLQLQVEQGETATEYEPYSSILVSVQAPGVTTKNNLFDGKMEAGGWSVQTGEADGNTKRFRCVNFIPIANPSNTTMEIINSLRSDDIWIIQYDNNKNFLGKAYTFNIEKGVYKKKLSLASNCAFIKFYEVGYTTLDPSIIYIISDNSTTLSTPSDLELRKVGDVEDGLDCSTGEVIERIGEIVLDGRRNVTYEENHGAFYIEIKTLLKLNDYSSSIISDKGRVLKDYTLVRNYSGNDLVLSGYKDINNKYENTNWLYLSKKDITSATDMKTWLSQNPITVQYRLAQESTKTIPLTIQNQDGNAVPHLQAFNETTHISTSSTGLIPHVVIPTTVSYPSIIKPSTLYTVKLKRSVTSGSLMINVGGTEQAVTSDCFTITTPSTLTSQDVIFSGKGNVISEVTVVEGDQTAKEYGYFEGMESVKVNRVRMTGKNLFNDKEEFISQAGNKIPVEYDPIEGAYKISIKDNFKEYMDIGVYKTINMKKGETLFFTGKVKNAVNVRLYINYDFTSMYYANYIPSDPNILSEFELCLTVAEDCLVHCRFWSRNRNTDIYFKDIQIEKNTSKTDYEPFKLNILTVNEDLELRGIGSDSNRVEDELDAKTGEVIERVGYADINSFVTSPSYRTLSDNSGYMAVIGLKNKKNRTNLRTNLFPASGLNNGDFGIYNNPANVVIFKKRCTREELESMVNQVQIIYELATESTRLIDISTVDQDNQPTQLGTFENVTHVSLESAGLIPEVEMEVATNLLEDTVFNLTNAFNTLYPTAEKPVVDGRLYGQTLVNLATQKSGRFNGTRFLRIPLSYTLKSNTNYFVNFIVKESTLTDGVTCRFKNTSTGITLGALKSSGIITTNANVADILEIYIDNTDDVTNGLDAIIDDIMVIEYQDGMENWDIPYFEGMQSVQAPGIKMIGKNLFDGVSYIDAFTTSAIAHAKPDPDVVSILIETDKNTDYILSAKTRFTRSIVGGSTEPIQLNSSLTIIESRRSENTVMFNSGEFTHIMLYLNNTKIDIEEIQVEKGTVATAYEPYKSITLSTPSDLELRKVGGVQDEVNVTTGEVVERIGEVVLDGSERWAKYATKNNISFYYYYIDNIYAENWVMGNIINDKLKEVAIGSSIPSESWEDNTITGIDSYFQENSNGIGLFKSIKTVDELKQYLQQNPITVQYKLATESVKTVDLSIVNQDGNTTKLRTFDDTTHVLLNSEGLIPTASLTVRTKIPSASSTSLLMDDISTNQQQLEATVDEQSNNVDATMIATTEIYEETL